MELGGAWALGKSTYPIVVPPLTRDEAVRQIGNVQMGVLGTSAEVSSILEELHDRLSQDLSLRTTTVAWNRATNSFKEQLPHRLQTVHLKATTAPVPPHVSAVAAGADGEGIGIANVTVLSGRLGTELHGEATNHDSKEHSASLKATFYGLDGAIVGTAEGVINQLRPSQTKTFTMLDIPEHARRKVEIDTLL